MWSKYKAVKYFRVVYVNAGKLEKWFLFLFTHKQSNNQIVESNLFWSV